MAISVQTPTTAQTEVTGEAAENAVASSFLGRFLLTLLVLVAIFVATYIYGWYNAYQLSIRFMKDANASYDQGNYPDALVGYQKFDSQTNKNVNYGGYFSVQKIWSSRYSWPMPSAVNQATQRAREIIYQKLTIQDAEQYIQANTGKPGAPYFGDIYLRLGELYEQNGDTVDAKDVYSSISNLFPNRPDLIQQATEHLKRLEGQG